MSTEPDDAPASDDAPTPEPTLPKAQANNPLHGLTLENILTRLVEHYGWQRLGKRIKIQCFLTDPSVKSSLTFLRKTPWARTKVEALYLATFREPT